VKKCKLIVLIILIISVSSLFGESFLSDAGSTKKMETYDEIEIMVNDLLLDDKIIVAEEDIPISVIDDGKYFVQMAAYSRLKPINLISKIEEQGYNTVITEVWRNGKKVNLLLVGPYASRDQLSIDMDILKSIEKNAFIYVAK